MPDNLSEPKPFAKHQYMNSTKRALFHDAVFARKLINIFKTQLNSVYQKLRKRTCRSAITQLAAQKLVNKSVQLCKQYVCALLKAVKKYVS